MLAPNSLYLDLKSYFNAALPTDFRKYQCNGGQTVVAGPWLPLRNGGTQSVWKIRDNASAGSTRLRLSGFVSILHDINGFI